MKTLKNLLSDESGVTAIEYGLIAALIAVAIIVTVQNTGTGVANTFGNVAGALPQ
jgi:pilus assembly protein Flp/PilA